MTTQGLEEYIKGKVKLAKDKKVDGIYCSLDGLIELAKEKEAEVDALKEEIRHLKFINQELVAEIDYLESEIREQDEMIREQEDELMSWRGWGAWSSRLR